MLRIGVPRGIQGPQGPKGEPGKDGSGSVSSVNGVASVGGNVTLTAADVGALPDTYTPPVTSVDGKTGDVSVDMLGAYPVGSIYMSVVETSPASLFGGTWEILNDVFLLAAGSYANAGTFGGAASVALKASELPDHRHGVYVRSDSGSYTSSEAIVANSYSYEKDGKANPSWMVTSAGLNGEAHNNMPPYLAVYMWKRVA